MMFYSDFQHTYFWLPFVGFTIGFIATMLGSGGGLFFPIILILLFQVPVQVAVPTSLAASLPLTLAGTTGNYRNGNIHFPLGLIFATGGIAGAIAGATITQMVDPEVLKTAFGIYSISLSVLIVGSVLRKKKKDNKPENNPSNKTTSGKLAGGLFFGFAGGAISGTFGASGAAPVLAGLLAMKLPVVLAIGTSLMVVFVNTLTALLGHSIVGKIDLTLVIVLTTGSILGAWMGAYTINRVKIYRWEKQIRYLFALVILISGILLIQ